MPEPNGDVFDVGESARRPEHPGIGDGRIAPPPRTESTEPRPRRNVPHRPHPHPPADPRRQDGPTGTSTESAAPKPPILRIPRIPSIPATPRRTQSRRRRPRPRTPRRHRASAAAGGRIGPQSRPGTRPAVRPPPPSRWPCPPPNDLPRYSGAPWRVVGPSRTGTADPDRSADQRTDHRGCADGGAVIWWFSPVRHTTSDRAHRVVPAAKPATTVPAALVPLWQAPSAATTVAALSVAGDHRRRRIGDRPRPGDRIAGVALPPQPATVCGAGRLARLPTTRSCRCTATRAVAAR